MASTKSSIAMATGTATTTTIPTNNNMAGTATHPIEMVTLIAPSQVEVEGAVETTTALTEAAQFWSRD
ncbi:hypothetical protein M5D96_007371 [Drosophila gunungcola]|uniref:Uncharacterized protein n=1 Tax=Drosophila gunungcola TaxID=103775 RepID=A0A9P9YN36_9MUSC|nr:hypothetical protein M5D96_007371 [Drosophila gunungcola]